MAEIRLQELRRARAGNHMDAVLAAEFDRGLRYAGHAGHQSGFGPHHAVHPDIFHAQVHRLLDDLFGNLRAGHHENRVRFFRDGFQVRVTGIALELAHARVDRVDSVALLLELLVVQVAAGLALVGYAHHGDTFLRQEFLCHIVDFCHQISPFKENRSHMAPGFHSEYCVASA